jgi:TusA-related sulfurtransferase
MSDKQAKDIRVEKPSEEAENLKAARCVDARGLFCPIPIVKLKLALQRLRPGDIVEITADDPAFPDDLVAWCKETGHILIHLDRQGEGEAYMALVEKAK